MFPGVLEGTSSFFFSPMYSGASTHREPTGTPGLTPSSMALKHTPISAHTHCNYKVRIPLLTVAYSAWSWIMQLAPQWAELCCSKVWIKKITTFYPSHLNRNHYLFSFKNQKKKEKETIVLCPPKMQAKLKNRRNESNRGLVSSEGPHLPQLEKVENTSDFWNF